jgi:hypothetical protein
MWFCILASHDSKLIASLSWCGWGWGVFLAGDDLKGLVQQYLGKVEKELSEVQPHALPFPSLGALLLLPKRPTRSP